MLEPPSIKLHRIAIHAGPPRWLSCFLVRPRSVKRHPKQASSPGSPVLKDQTALEIQVGVVSDTAIQGLVSDWIASMIVDRIIETVLKAAHR